LENILYGKCDASNTEIKNACDLANASEFIENDEINNFNKEEETNQSLLEKMEKNKEQIEAVIGAAKYSEEIEVLKK
jgi:ABC-type multidrug transport system fused ATPase/permease subunit